jgi:penicillin amidase
VTRSRLIACLSALAVALTVAPVTAEPPVPLPVAGATVHVDEWGVPHVEAEDPMDAARGFGYAQASERLFEMDVIRRLGQGRLSELLGESAYAADVEMRRHFYDAADVDRQLAALPAHVTDLLQAYSEGVNLARLEQLADPTQLPAVYAALADLPAEWTPHDSASVLLLFTMASFAGEGEGGELQNAARWAELVERFGAQEARRVFEDFHPVNDDSAPSVIQPEDAAPAPEGVAHPDRPDPAQLALDPASATRAFQLLDNSLAAAREALARVPVPRVGSYAYALSGDRTASGGGLLLGAPQAGWTFPSTFHEVGIHTPASDCRGMTVPGLGPWVAIGQCNGHTWSLVAGNAGDQVDVYVEQLDAADADRYLVHGRAEPFTQRTETFLVKSALEQQLERRTETFRYSRHGAVFDTDGEAGVAFALRRAQTGLFARTFEGLHRLNTVSGVPAVVEEVLPHLYATYNAVFADAQGNIGYAFTGLQPVRADGFDRRFPMPGTGEAEWQGFLPVQDRPHVVNPDSGLIVVAQGVESKPAPWWPASSSLSIGRVNRIEALRAHFTGDGWNAERMAAADRATIERLDAQIRHLAPYLDEALAGVNADSDLAPLAQIWRSWSDADFVRADADGDGRFDHPGAAVFSPDRYYGMPSAPMWEHLVRLVFADDVPGGGWGHWFARLSQVKHAFDGTQAERPLSRDYLNVDEPSPRARKEARPATPADSRPPRREALAEQRIALVREALRRSVPDLEKRYGIDRAGWRLAIPTIKFQALGISAPPRMRVVDHGTYNQVVDPAAGEAHSVLPPGNGRGDRATDEARAQLTGEVPAHAADQIARYVAWDHKPMHVADYRQAAVTTYTVPRPG